MHRISDNRTVPDQLAEFATTAAVAYLGEQLNSRFIIGAILIFGSMSLVDLKSRCTTASLKQFAGI